MTYQYVTKTGALKSFEAASQSAAMSMLNSFADRAPNSGIIAAPATQSAVTPAAAPAAPAPPAPAAPVNAPPTAEAIAAALSKNPEYQKYAGNNSTAAILDAYQTGNWAGVTDLSGKPFSDAQQSEAVAAATKALNPAYVAQQAYDTAGTEDTLAGDQQAYDQFERDQGINFQADKTSLDQNAADNGVLFSGARIQKQNDLKTRYANAEADKRAALGNTIDSTTRDYQYAYGNDAAKKLSSYYSVPGAQTYNPGVARGGVRTSPSLSAVYDPSAYNFQGTKPVAQKTAIQTRAAGLLANRANKLTLSGVGAKL